MGCSTSKDAEAKPPSSAPAPVPSDPPPVAPSATPAPAAPVPDELPPIPKDADVDALSVKDLKRAITEAGLSFVDCFEKSELRARAREALGQSEPTTDEDPPNVAAAADEDVKDTEPTSPSAARKEAHAFLLSAASAAKDALHGRPLSLVREEGDEAPSPEEQPATPPAVPAEPAEPVQGVIKADDAAGMSADDAATTIRRGSVEARKAALAGHRQEASNKTSDAPPMVGEQKRKFSVKELSSRFNSGQNDNNQVEHSSGSSISTSDARTTIRRGSIQSKKDSFANSAAKTHEHVVDEARMHEMEVETRNRKSSVEMAKHWKDVEDVNAMTESRKDF